MSNDIRHSHFVEPSLEQVQRYIEEARQLRNEALLRGIRQAFAAVRPGLRALRTRLGGAFHPVGAKAGRAPGAC